MRINCKNKRCKQRSCYREVKKRYVSLLEVLIAFALIVLCVLPLIYPHVAMFKSQKAFIRKVELDHVVNLLYAKILEKLYMNSIPWQELGDGKISGRCRPIK